MNRENIEQLFGGYFHEDWNEEASEPSEVVDNFVRTSGMVEAELESLAKDLQEIAQRHEGQKDNWLFRELGCCFDPSADGQTDSEWVRDLALQLIAKMGQAPQ